MNKKEREQWLRERKTYIGGSDIGCILGLSKYKTALDVYLDKIGDTIEESTSEAAHWGNMLEDVVAKEYASRTGLEVTESEGLIRHKKHPFIAANIDRWVDGKKHVLECKTANFMKGKEWGEQVTDQIPELYLCQVAYYAAICDVEKVDIAVLIGGQEFRMYSYKRNKEFEDKLIRVAVNFWNNYVVKMIAPNASNLGDVGTLYPKSNGLEIEANSDVAIKIESLKDLMGQSKHLGKEMESLQCEIKKFMQDNEVLIDQGGQVKATWRNGSPRSRLDSKKLASEHKAIYQQYLTEGKAARTFLIK